MSEPLQPVAPEKWRPMDNGELADLRIRFERGRLSDPVELRRAAVLRLLAEIERRSIRHRVRAFFGLEPRP